MSIGIETGVSLGSAGARDLLGDVYRPEDAAAAPHPAVVLVFGGGWSTGDRGQQKGYGIALAKAGFVCLAPDYRLTGEAPWPAQIEDVCQAVRWLRDNAAMYRADPARLAVSGHSSGGHLALLAAAREPVAAVCAFYAPTDLDALCALTDGKASIEGLLGPAPSAERLAAASPLSGVRSGLPAALLITGDADRRVPHAQTLRLYEAWIASGNCAELHVFAGQPHAFDMDREMFAVTSAIVANFFRRHA